MREAMPTPVELAQASSLHAISVPEHAPPRM